MSMKVSIDDLFEKEEGELTGAVDRLQVWEQRLDILLGMAVMWVILMPEVFDRSSDISYAPLLWLTLVAAPAISGFYLLVWPSCRQIPFAARRLAIVRSFTITLLSFGSLSLFIFLYPSEQFLALISLLAAAIAGYALHKINMRWQDSDAEELFP